MCILPDLHPDRMLWWERLLNTSFIPFIKGYGSDRRNPSRRAYGKNEIQCWLVYPDRGEKDFTGTLLSTQKTATLRSIKTSEVYITGVTTTTPYS